MKIKMFAACTLVCVLGLGCRSHRERSTADVFNENAKLSGALPYPVLQWDALTTRVDRGALTTSTLFGNAVAATAAHGAQTSYPAGAVLGLVTWGQRDDPHWFGARIPDAPATVEFVEFGANGKPVYRRFGGSPLSEQAVAESAERVASIEAMKAVVLP